MDFERVIKHFRVIVLAQLRGSLVQKLSDDDKFSMN